MILPQDHPKRFQLNDEVHARPPEALTSPTSITYLALFAAGSRGEDHRAIVELADKHGVTPPETGVSHYSQDFGAFRLKWERHTEFSRLKVIVPDSDGANFAKPAIQALPEDWVAALPGETMVATHVLLLPAPKKPIDPETLANDAFGGNWLIGSRVGGGAATAYTDFRIHSDGFSRLIAYDNGLKPRQAGRMIQRLLEIDTYRMMALLAFPVARELAPRLSTQERELAQIANAMSSNATAEEPMLLDRLTRLQSMIESGHADTDYRFAAARAYYDLVKRRIEELREERLEGLQTYQEFTERRLMPAIQTCDAVAARQEELSRRVARATQLLSTRVAVARERQSQQVLQSMDRRAKLQLRLQETVEGLSVAAVTYYAVGLIGYLAKALAEMGLPISPAVIMGISIPIIAGLVWYGVRRVRPSRCSRCRQPKPV
jgi:uncharacterized membrane-anchored protein